MKTKKANPKKPIKTVKPKPVIPPVPKPPDHG
jgi:hypothetical protein